MKRGTIVILYKIVAIIVAVFVGYYINNFVVFENSAITPWCVVAPLFLFNAIFALFAWRKLGYTQRGCRIEMVGLLFNAFIPLFTYHELFPIASTSDELTLFAQIAIYTIGQAIWIIAIDIAPSVTANIMRKRN